MRAAQARSFTTAPLLRAGIAMIEAKTANQASLLRYLARAPARRDGDVGDSLRAAAEKIRAASRSLARLGEEDYAEDQLPRARVMGLEGHAAALYWSALAQLIPEDLGFPGRRLQGATDPVNCALNYVYGMLYARVWQAIVRAGLDPGVGIVHLAPRSGGALIYDLVEELRAPLADRTVLSLLSRGAVPTLRRGTEDSLTART
ncbi:MAG: CRISPR-associated endonuclease Cas1, partial [Myxococcota bacterium]